MGGGVSIYIYICTHRHAHTLFQGPATGWCVHTYSLDARARRREWRNIVRLGDNGICYDNDITDGANRKL